MTHSVVSSLLQVYRFEYADVRTKNDVLSVVRKISISTRLRRLTSKSRQCDRNGVHTNLGNRGVLERDDELWLQLSIQLRQSAHC